MVACCCWVLYRWWLGRPLVCRFLLGMVGMNNNIRNNRSLHWGPQVLHLQGSFQSIKPQFMLVRAIRRSSEVFLFPKLHYLHHAAFFLNNNVNTFSLYEALQVLRHEGLWVLKFNLRCSS
jgi:hypothetical protein